MSDARSATIIRVVKNRDNPYVVIHQGVFLDPRLSWKAKGLLGYFLSRPDDWTIQVRDLVRRSRDGRDSVYAGLAELKAAGYVEQRVLRQPNGRIAQVEYVVYEQPQDAPAAPDSDTPAPAPTPVPAATSGFSGTGKAGSGKAGRLLNNDLTKYGGDNNNSAADPAYADDSTPSGRLSPTAVVVSPGTVSEPARPGGAAPQPEQGERVRPVQRPLLLPDADARTLANRLHGLGIPGRLAHRWVAQDRAQCVQVLAWLDVCPPAEQPTNPAGWVRRAIEEHWAQPPKRNGPGAARRILRPPAPGGRSSTRRTSSTCGTPYSRRSLRRASPPSLWRPWPAVAARIGRTRALHGC
jgi:hypothetical protein